MASIPIEDMYKDFKYLLLYFTEFHVEHHILETQEDVIKCMQHLEPHEPDLKDAIERNLFQVFYAKELSIIPPFKNL